VILAIANTVVTRFLVCGLVFALFFGIIFLFGKMRPFWWSLFLIVSVPAWIIGYRIDAPHFELLAGGLIIFGMLGTMMGALGLSHIAFRKKPDDKP